MEERDLKRWLKITYDGCGINFVEPAYGGSIGMPDVEITVGETILPIELKIAKILKRGGISLDIRPSQRHYHITANQKTAIMFAVEHVEDGSFNVYLFDGKLVENDMWKTDRRVIMEIANEQCCSTPYDRDELNFKLQQFLNVEAVRTIMGVLR